MPLGTLERYSAMLINCPWRGLRVVPTVPASSGFRKALLFLAAGVIAASPPAGGIDSRVMFTGFEWQTAELFTSSGTFSFSTTTVRPGGSLRSLRTNPTGTGTGFVGLRTRNGAGQFATYSRADVWYTFGFRYGTKPASGDEELFRVDNPSNTLKFTLRINSAGNLVAYDATGTLLATGTTALSADTWYLLGVRVGTGTSGAAWAVEIDGAPEISGTGNLGVGNNGQYRLGKVTNRNGNDVDFYFDDTWADYLGFVGNHSTVILVPNADGSTMDFNAGTGPSDYTQVNTLPPNASTYVMSPNDSAQHTALFALDDSSVRSISGTVHSLLVLTRAREDVGYVSNYVVRLKSGATNYDTDGVDVGTSGGSIGFYVDRNLDLGVAWTPTVIDSLEAGGLKVDTNAGQIRISDVCLMVAFTTGAPPAFQAAWARNANVLLHAGRAA